MDTEVNLVWKRWGSWHAHLYKNDVALCRFPQGNFKRGVQLGKNPAKLVTLIGDDLSPHGMPYGRTCTSCLKIFNRKDKQL